MNPQLSDGPVVPVQDIIQPMMHSNSHTDIIASLNIDLNNLKHTRRKTTHGIPSHQSNLLPGLMPRSLTPRKGYSLSKIETRLMKLHNKGISTYEKHGRKYIYGGTKEKIVLKILRWLVTESNRNDIFHMASVLIHGYRLYFSPTDMFDTLISFWDKPASRSARSSRMDMIRSSIMLFLTLWWERSIEQDFINDLEEKLMTWIEQLPENYKLPLMAKYERTKKEKTESSTMDIPRHLQTDTYYNFADVPEDIIASHLTISDVDLFMQMPILEFYKEKRDYFDSLFEASANFTRSIVGFIVEKKNIKDRCKAIKKILKISQSLERSHNYNSLMCCWAALNSSHVSRLSKTKKRLSKSTLDMWNSFEEKLSEIQNFSTLRNLMLKSRKQGSALIPWFELIIKGRNHVDEYPSVFYSGKTPLLYEEQTIINFTKLEHLNEIIEEFVACQKNCKDYKQILESKYNQSVKNTIKALASYSDQDLWELSHSCEPHQRKSF